MTLILVTLAFKEKKGRVNPYTGPLCIFIRSDEVIQAEGNGRIREEQALLIWKTFYFHSFCTESKID